jgi:hypothetical protein
MGRPIRSLVAEDRSAAGVRDRGNSNPLDPRWVRAATVHYGHPRSPTATNGSQESQAADRPAQAAGRMQMGQVGDSDCGPEGPEFESLGPPTPVLVRVERDSQAPRV